MSLLDKCPTIIVALSCLLACGARQLFRQSAAAVHGDMFAARRDARGVTLASCERQSHVSCVVRDARTCESHQTLFAMCDALQNDTNSSDK